MAHLPQRLDQHVDLRRVFISVQQSSMQPASRG